MATSSPFTISAISSRDRTHNQRVGRFLRRLSARLHLGSNQRTTHLSLILPGPILAQRQSLDQLRWGFSRLWRKPISCALRISRQKRHAIADRMRDQKWTILETSLSQCLKCPRCFQFSVSAAPDCFPCSQGIYAGGTAAKKRLRSHQSSHKSEGPRGCRFLAWVRRDEEAYPSRRCGTTEEQRNQSQKAAPSAGRVLILSGLNVSAKEDWEQAA